MKRTIALVLAVVLVAALFVGCAKNGGNSEIVGTWALEMEGLELMSFTFNADGTGSLDALGEGEEFTYTVTGNKINMTADGETESCEYSVKGDTMTLDIEGESLELIKK